jgi:release factor glutamine methyltransferase
MPETDPIPGATFDPIPGGGTVAVGEALRRWTAVLARAGIDGAGGDVRRLVAAVLEVSAAQLLSEPERILTGVELATLSACVARRSGREPVSRILGQRNFYGRTFAISPATLDPRPDSETLIEAALETARQEGWGARGGLRILDVGTGSGCLLLTLLAELDVATGMGTDISQAALAVARQNADRLGLSQRASWLIADGLETVPGPFHMLISNPPYVRTGEIAQLEPEVRKFDPAAALDGGADGLTLYRAWAPRLARVVPDGWIVLEVGHDQADAVAAIIANGVGQAVADLRIYADVTGMRRCVAMRTRAGTHAQKGLGSWPMPR